MTTSEEKHDTSQSVVCEALTRSRRWLFGLAIALLSMFLGLLLCEVGVRLFVTVRNVGPSFSVYDPESLKTLKRSFTCRRITPEFTMRFSTNSLGVRGPEPKAFPDSAILFLGDSFTMGYGVNDGEEYPALIRAALDKLIGVGRVPVVNAGIGDVGLGRWVKFLQDEAERFTPRVIVIQVSANDIADDLREGLYSVGSAGNLVASARLPDRNWKRSMQSIIEAVPGLPYSHLVSFSREVRFDGRSKLRQSPHPHAKARSSDSFGVLTNLILTRMLELCRSSEWPVLGILADDDKHLLSQVRGVFDGAGVSYVMAPRKDERPELYYHVDGHWTSEGHERVAELVLPLILQVADLSE
ncbi:MAG: hypothetical protein JSU63_11870 [Phycisphaerales bacterium]|nr:MAG: hypothetical protein JSU63_11870 [Phycisphaerales bacterium]